LGGLRQACKTLRDHSNKLVVEGQEFNLEKLNLLETEKQRIRKEYERKEAQVEANKKMCAATDDMNDINPG
jgi:hypothetical protein